MHVLVRLFAAHREAAGRSTHVVSVPDGCTVADVFERVSAEFPEIARTARAVAFALNRAHSDPQTRVAEGDEVAFLPPVAGG